MPFILEHNSTGLACPRFQCDECDALITDAHGAMLLWDSDAHKNNVIIPTILCQKCDEAGHPDLPDSMELDPALVYLLDNCQMTERRLAGARKIAQLLSSV